MLPEKITDLSEYYLLEEYKKCMLKSRESNGFNLNIANLFISSLEKFFSSNQNLKNAELIKEMDGKFPIYSFKNEDGEDILLNEINSSVKAAIEWRNYYNVGSLESILNKMKITQNEKERFDLYDSLSNNDYIFKNENIKDLINDYRKGLKEGLVVDKNEIRPFVKYFRHYDDYELMQTENEKNLSLDEHYFKLNIQFLLLYLVEKSSEKNDTYYLVDNKENHTLTNDSKKERFYYLDLILYINKVNQPILSNDISLHDAVKNIISAIIGVYKNDEFYEEYYKKMIVEKDKRIIYDNINMNGNGSLQKKRI